MPSSTVENYVKAIYALEETEGGGGVPTGRLAEALAVTPGTATAMIKSLARARLAVHEPYGGVRLTAKGRTLALRIIRRHRLIETFLVETLGLDWSEVHDEAERLEHVISDRLLERLDEFLGRPTVDPHGDPIPDADGHIREPAVRPLSECAAGQRVRIARIADQDEAFLQFVDRCGLRPGTRATIEHHDTQADSITVRPHRHSSVTLGRAAAMKLLVEAR